MSTALCVVSCPPLISTAQPYRLANIEAMFADSWMEVADWPVSAAASGMFGVINVASGSSSCCIMLTALSASSRAPLVATMTGSITFGIAEKSASFCATTWISSALDSMPVLMAPTW